MPSLENDVKVTVTSDRSPEMQVFAASNNDIENLLPTGLVLRYGLNSIPAATLDLSPQDLDIVCDMSRWRRTPIKIRLESIHGCLTFRGLIDGVSMSQSIGDMRMQMVVKHPFQLLSEINPKLLGYHSAGVDFTRRVEALQMEMGNSEATVLRYAIGSAVSANLGKPLFEGIIELLKAIVQSQLQWERTQARVGRSAEAAVSAAKAIGEKHLLVAETLLKQIDTQFVPTKLSLADFYVQDYVLETICETRSNLFDILLTLLETVGCGLVIGNNKAYIVPNSGFLEQTHRSTINFREVSKTPNIIFPAQYNNISFNDNGYRDISGVYVMSDDKNINGIDGFFKDDKYGGSGGIIGEVMPYVISFNNAALRAAGIPEVTKSAGDPARSNSQASEGSGASEEAQHEAVKKSAEEEKKASDEAQKQENEIEQKKIDALYKFADQWAELRYYQLKYTDRMGGIGLLFNPNCAPGAIGTTYLRAPGVFIDFFVTEVTHEIRLNAPDHGSAITSIGFNCGRMGSYTTPGALAPGLKQLDLFDGFDAARSAKVAAAFVKDIQ
ncbi:hypothetical protein EKK58_01370 [Candidatus Dependentiae bacterium]|nr:MAG: hypothetical protein EKK58_01370 [Candidatus Dependentiae bacterium]